MPLQMTSELRFPMGASTPLSGGAVDEFLGLARRITSTLERKQIIETFKEYFCRVSGEYYASSSSLSWAESDLERHASSASSDAPGFIAAFCDACEGLGGRDIAVPSHAHVNNILEKHNVPYRIIDNELCETTDYISPPEPTASPSPASVVARALSDAKALIGHANASSAIDRAHTALHGYLFHLCANKGIEANTGITTAKAFKLLRESHPALAPDGPRAADVTRVLQAFATSIDAFSTIRNKASLAHANELLDEPEATAVINAIYTIFRYIQDCLQRYEH
jgi:hypothetical protein